MSKKPAIKQDVILKAWKLHESGVPNDLISYTLGLSDKSVKRIIRLFTAANNGNDIDAIEGDRYHLIKKSRGNISEFPRKKRRQNRSRLLTMLTHRKFRVITEITW